jgi:GNAT superfamily N-acetyltransferase
MGLEAVVEYATEGDLPFLERSDRYVPGPVLRDKIARREVLVARREGAAVGWLRFGLFWDTIPFMNMLFLLEPHRGQGIGRQLVGFWEDEMRRLGHRWVLTSTQANEDAQHFYRKLGYADAGGFLPPDGPLELILSKSLA